MLAAWGFYLTGLCFGIFAATFETHVVRKTKLDLGRFSYAYLCLAGALLVWGFAAADGSQRILNDSVLVGDGLLLLGSLFMLDIWLGKKNRQWIGLAAAAAIVLLFVRVHYYAPAPYLNNGVLIFDTQRPAAAVLALIFGLVWLPVNLKVAKQVTHKIKQDSIYNLYSSIYVIATISALVFIATRRRVTVILSFVALGLCFVMLIWSNLLAAKVLEGKHGK